MRQNWIRLISIVATAGSILAACAPLGVKEAAVSGPIEQEKQPIHPDYSSNWWKDQPNGNASDDDKWNGEGWILTANEVSDGVTVTDIQTGKPIAYFQGEGTPHHIHLNKEQTWAYATQRYGSTVLAIDMTTLKSKEIEFPGFDKKPGPQHLTFSYDGKYAFVSLNGVEAVAQIDAETAELVRVIKGVGKKPRDLNVTPDGKKLYVSLQAEPFITVVDLETYELKHLERTKTDYGKGTGSGLDMSVDGQYVAVANTADNEVVIYETPTDQPIAKIGNIPNPVNLSFMGKTSYLATGNRGDGSMSIIDTQKMKLIKTIKTGGGTNIPYVGPDGLWYTSQNGAGYLSVIDPSQDFRITRKIWAVQNVHWLYWSPDGGTLYGTNWGDKTVTQVDLSKRKDFRKTYLVGLNPNGIALKTNVPPETLEKYRENNAEAANLVEKASTLVLPEARDDNERAFLNTCLQCHDIGRVMRNNNKGDQWIETVNRMEGNGAKMSPEDKQAIIDYLKSDQHKSLSIKTQLQNELSDQKGMK